MRYNTGFGRELLAKFIQRLNGDGARRVMIGLALVVVVCGVRPLTVLAEEVGLGEAFDAGWSRSGYWDDGLAEVAVYDAERVIYGAARAHEEVRIVVAEPMRTDLHVKPEAPYAGKPMIGVLKCNIFARVPTPNYPYHLMTSLFFDRAAPARLVKATYSSQEWCGTTFKDLRFYESPPRYTANSYWDEQAVVDQVMEWPEGGLLEDQLAVSLRAWKIEAGRFLAFNLASSQVGNKVSVPKSFAVREIGRTEASDSIEAMGRVYAPEQQKVLEVRGPVATKNPQRVVARFVVDAEPPTVLLDYEFADGRRGRLRHVERRAYWKLKTRNP